MPMNSKPFILLAYADIDLNATNKTATPPIPVGDVDAWTAQVSVESQSTTIGTAILTLESSPDGIKWATIDSTLATATTLTPAAPQVQRVDCKHMGKLRARVSTLEGAALKATVKVLLRRGDGFDKNIVAQTLGADALLNPAGSVSAGSSTQTGASGNPQ